MTMIKLGPITVRTSCNVQSQSQSGITTLVALCDMIIKNTSRQTLYLSVTSTGIGSSTRTAPQFHETTWRPLYPGQQIRVPAPPEHQEWHVTLMSRRRVKDVMQDLGDIGWVILGLAGYGGYEVYKHRKQISQRVQRIF